MRTLLIVAALLGLLAVSLAQSAAQDMVNTTNIPQIPQSYNYTWYSGYLNITATKAFHYVFFESQYDPRQDPLVLWLNGGPGCSSMLGMLYENGPFVFVPNTTTLQLNPYSWNKKANVLYLESPAGVGFSVGNTSDIPTNDNQVAQDNLNALSLWFDRFPGYLDNSFYISGESYAGIYIPYLALAIYQWNLDPTLNEGQIINLKGILVGNACTDPSECYNIPNNSMSIWQNDFLYFHAMYSPQLRQQYAQSCQQGYDSPGCVSARTQIFTTFNVSGINLYDIYGICYNQPWPPGLDIKKIKSSSVYARWTMNRNLNEQANNNSAPCADQIGILTLLNNDTLRSAFNIGLNSSALPWYMCSDAVGNAYTSNANASVWIYDILTKFYKVWVFSGDTDACVPITGTMAWINAWQQRNGVPVISPWRPWYKQGVNPNEQQMAGNVLELSGLTFVSVRDAGHMVPQFQPKSAYVMFDAFVHNNPLPYHE